MNPLLVNQIIQFIQWLISGALSIKENDAFIGTVLPQINAALLENRPLTEAEWQPIHDAAQQAHDELRDA